MTDESRALLGAREKEQQPHIESAPFFQHLLEEVGVSRNKANNNQSQGHLLWALSE